MGIKPSLCKANYSILKLFTGLARAALMVWKLSAEDNHKRQKSGYAEYPVNTDPEN
jgi:hypothetical protein